MSGAAGTPLLDLGNGYRAEPWGPRTHRVYSPATLQHYLVDAAAGKCECPDSRVRKNTCKHLTLLKAALAAAARAPSAPESETGREVIRMTEAKPADAASDPGGPSGLAVAQDERLLYPVATVERLREAVKKFIEVRDGLLDASDIVATKHFAEVGRTGWDKVALAFNVSVDVEKCEPIEIGGRPAFRAKAVAAVPGNHRRSAAHGVCTLEEVQERSGKPEPRAAHFAAAIAESRAVKRALAGLTGGRDLAPEEIKAIQARKT